jgi:hypothetical protein
MINNIQSQNKVFTRVQYNLHKLNKPQKERLKSKINTNITYSFDQWKLYKLLCIDNDPEISKLFNDLDFSIINNSNDIDTITYSFN